MSFRNQGLYQKNRDITEPVKSQLWLDLDDLHLFRLLGLGLRYVELERGIAEARNNTGFGDAVSLANYGLNKDWRCLDEVTTSNALQMQDEMRKCIEGTLRVYHKNDERYNEAAFLLVVRGSHARSPRDFHAYPLGKCEKGEFASHQVLAIVKSDELKNKNLAHAAEQCFQSTIAAINTKKIQITVQLRESLRKTAYDNLIPVLDRLIQCYRNGVVINAPILSSIMQCAVKAGCYKSDENLRYFDSQGFPYLGADAIIAAMDKVDDKQLKATGKVKRLDEYKHPLADLCTNERDPATFAKVKALLPHANAYAKYMAMRRCTLELMYCDACNCPRAAVPERDKKAAQHYWQLRRLVIASLTEQECAEISIYHTEALAKALPSPSAKLLVGDLMGYEIGVDGDDKALIERNLRLCFDDELRLELGRKAR